MRYFIGSVLFAGALAFAQNPTIIDGQIVNSAGLTSGQPVSPGALISIFGSNLADGLAYSDSATLSSTLATTSVTINGTPAPLYSVSPTFVTAVVPWSSLPAGQDTTSGTVVVTRAGAASDPSQVIIAKAAPGVFTISFGFRQVALVYDAADGALAQNTLSIPGLSSHPTSTGKTLIILATGLGLVDPPIADGKAPGLNAPRTTLLTPTVTIGGTAATVVSSGMSPDYPGVFQIVITVPDGLIPGPNVLQVQSAGSSSSDQLTIAVN